MFKKTKISSWISIFLLFFVLLNAPALEVCAYGNSIGHPLLTEKIAQLYNLLYDPDLTADQISQMVQGSRDEDTPPRWINHFYDPITGLGWQGQRLGNMPKEEVLTAAYVAFNKVPVSTMVWAGDQKLQSEEYSFYQGDRTLNSAVLYYINNEESQAYNALGHSLHLIEDMAVPAHTRQDTHVDFSSVDFFASLIGAKMDKGESYENWVEQNGKIDQGLIDELSRSYQPVCSSLDNCLAYLADYSNGNFFSQDTILDGSYGSPEVVRYINYGTGLNYGYDRNNRLLFKAEINQSTREITNIELNADGYWSELSNKAILAGVEVIKYFNNQVEKVRTGQINIERPKEISFWDKIRGISPYGEAVKVYRYLARTIKKEHFLASVNSEMNINLSDTTTENPSGVNVTISITGLDGWMKEVWDDLSEGLDSMGYGYLVGIESDGSESEMIEWPPPIFNESQIEWPPPIVYEEHIEWPPPQIQQIVDLVSGPQNPDPQIGLASSDSGGYGTNPGYPKILITEVQLASTTDAKDEFVELYNPKDIDMDLSGWYLQRKTKNAQDYSTFGKEELFLGKVIKAKDYLLIAREGSLLAPVADIVVDHPLTEDNSLSLKKPNREVSDRVGFGQASDYEAAPAINPPNGKTLARKWHGDTQSYQDTDNNGEDFEVQGPTPRTENTQSQTIDPEPALIDSVAPSALFNILAEQTSLDFTVGFNITDLSSGGVSPSGLAAFQLRFKEGDGEWQEDAQQIIGGSPATYSGARDFEGVDGVRYYLQLKAKDANGNESDWLPETPAETLVRMPKLVLINEIQTDSIIGAGGTSDDWTELYNPNDTDVSLAGWSLQKHSESDPCSVGASFYKKNFPAEAVIPAKGFFLIVDSQANDGLKDLSDLTIGWSLTDDNTIYLVSNQDEVASGDDVDIVDKVGFGSACFAEGSPASNPPEALSIERRVLGSDSNNNSIDFKVSDAPSPKGKNPIVTIQDITNYSTTMVFMNGAYYYNLTIKWASPSQSNLDFYQVQYKKNDSEWRDWFAYTQQLQADLLVVYAMMYDNNYSFRARAKDRDGNTGDWTEIRVGLSNPVVINEVALAGTNSGPSGQDQWLELYNKSDSEVDITGWHLISGYGGSDTLDLTLEGIIPAKSYFILERGNDEVIADVPQNQLFISPLVWEGYTYLTDKSHRTVDAFYIPMSGGYAEDRFVQEDNYYSMERISPYAFGLDSLNWKLNNGQTINGQDSEANPIYGTPGQRNSIYLIYTPLFMNFVEDATLIKYLDGQNPSPYLIHGDVVVLEGKVLSIEPGVIMKFNNFTTGIKVEGTMRALGTSGDQIVFTSSQPEPQQRNWGGLYFSSTSRNSQLENVLIQYAGGTATYHGAGVRIDGSNVSIIDSVIQSSLVALWLQNSPSVIDSTQILDNQQADSQGGGYGILIEGGSPTVRDSLIARNFHGVHEIDWTDPVTGGVVPSTPILENNLFVDNTQDFWPHTAQ